MRVVPLIELGRLAAKRDFYLRQWHPHFLLFPRRINGNDWRWLETVERKLEFVGGHDGTYTFAHYRLPKPTPITEGEK